MPEKQTHAIEYEFQGEIGVIHINGGTDALWEQVIQDGQELDFPGVGMRLKPLRLVPVNPEYITG